MSHFISRFFILDKSPLAIQHYFPADLNTLVSSRILAHTFNCFVYDYCGVFMPGGSSRAATGDARTTFLAGHYSERETFDIIASSRLLTGCGCNK